MTSARAEGTEQAWTTPVPQRAQSGGNPAVDRLLAELEGYLDARLQRLVTGAEQRLVHMTAQLTDVANGNSTPAKLLGRTALGSAHGRKLSGVRAAAAGIWHKASGRLGGKGKGSSGGRFMTIVEDIDIGVPVETAYDMWTRFTQAPRWSKATQSVIQHDESKTVWKAKVFWSTRDWTSTITERIRDERIVWKSEGAKGVVHGSVTFHPLTDNLTRVLLTLQYHPGGLVEKTGNLWRAQGRRTRLDLKAFRRFIAVDMPNSNGDDDDHRADRSTTQDGQEQDLQDEGADLREEDEAYDETTDAEDAPGR